MKIYCLLTALFIISICNTCFGQSKDRILKIDLLELNISYRQPRGFIESDSTEAVNFANGHFHNALDYSLKTNKADIIVGISFQHLAPPSDFVKRLAPNYDPNKNYLHYTELRADTTKEKVVFYSKEYCRKKFNADVGAKFCMTSNRSFRGKYPYCKVVILHKENRSDIMLLYFYTDESRKELDRIIKQTAGMLRYKDEI